MRDAIAYVHDGKIGKVKLANGLCYKPRGSIGKVDGPTRSRRRRWTTTCGAARRPKTPLARARRLHYDWHWIWDYGNGDLGNQGVHEMDKARWGLGKNELPKSRGQRRRPVRLRRRRRDGQHAAVRVRLRRQRDDLRGPRAGATARTRRPGRQGRECVGNIWYGDEGYVVCPNYNSGVAYDQDGKEVAEVHRRRRPVHFDNFVKAVRSRQARGPELRHRRGAPVGGAVPPGATSATGSASETPLGEAEGDRRRQGGERLPASGWSPT